MQIQEITIHNFASIKHQSIQINDYNLIIGENNVGKTNTINAIRVFFGDLSYSPEHHQPDIQVNDDECWIEVKFLPTSGEWKTLDQDYKQSDSSLIVRRYLTSWEADSKTKKAGIYGILASGQTKTFCSAADMKRGQLGEVIYIPAVSKIEDQTKTTGPSPLRDAITQIVDNIIEYSTAYAELEKSFAKFALDIMGEKTSDNLSLESLQGEISDSLKHWGIKFRLGIDKVSPDAIIKNLIYHKIEDIEQATEQDTGQYGAGMQREIIFQLIRISAKYSSKTSELKGDFVPSLTLYLFEEPEAFLHPNQQLELARNLNNIANSQYTQVILSSHSPHFVSYESENLTSIIRLHKKNGETIVGQITDTDLQQILADNESINKILRNVHPDDRTNDMEEIKYFMWLDPDRCGMFFASKVLVVEGATEKVFINYLIKSGVIQIEDGNGIYILDCLGKYNVHRFVQLLGALKVDHSILLDDDNGALKNVDNFIASFKNSYTFHTHYLKGDLEQFLGISSVPKHDRYRKPQNALYNYKQGNYNTKNFKTFVGDVEILLA